MSFTSIIKLARRRRLVPALKVNALYKPFYKLTYLASAKTNGLLDLLSDGPMPFEAIAEIYCRDAKAREALDAWLRLGLDLGLLGSKHGSYFLRGLLLEMARPENDATLALAQEVATLHHKLVFDTPAKLRNGELWELEDQDGELTARSSRALEVFQLAAIDKFFPKTGAIRLLEVGCGSAIYIRHAAQRNPSLRALGLELQPNVANIALSNVRKWGLADRIAIEIGDIRDRESAREYDIVSLYNNIYYFPVQERVALLQHVKSFINPGGFLLLTSCCQGGNLGMDALNLWGAATRTGGRLPTVAEMRQQLREAGYGSVQSTRLIPGDGYYAFRAGTDGC